MSVWYCGKCMNSSEFHARTIVPQQGECEWCGDNGTIWELLGVYETPPAPSGAHYPPQRNAEGVKT